MELIARAFIPGRLDLLWRKPMTCAHYLGQSCGLGCCLARAEQFALFEYSEPSFEEFCPLVQRYGEILNDVRAKKEKDQGIHWSSRRWQALNN